MSGRRSQRHLVRLGLALLAVAGLAGAGRAEDAASLNPLAALERDALKGIVELPLFDPSRRLPPPPPMAVVDAPPQAVLEPAPNLQLVGVVHGRRDVAIVHRDGAEKTILLRNGERIGAWTVHVHALGVTLRDGDRRVDLAIFAKGAAAPAPPQPVTVGQVLRRPPDE